MVHGGKQTPVDVEETTDGSLIVHLQGRELFKLEPVEVAFPDMATAQNRQPVLSDLNGDPAHDWPLFVRRFQKLQPDLLLGVAHYYKSKGYTAPSIDNLLRAEEDMEQLLFTLPNLITDDGQLKRGHRARIADQLGVKDAGGYRGRIDAVVSLILASYEELLGNSGPKLGNFGQLVGNKAKSTQFQKPQKAVNQ